MLSLKKCSLLKDTCKLFEKQSGSSIRSLSYSSNSNSNQSFNKNFSSYGDRNKIRNSNNKDSTDFILNEFKKALDIDSGNGNNRNSGYHNNSNNNNNNRKTSMGYNNSNNKNNYNRNSLYRNQQNSNNNNNSGDNRDHFDISIVGVERILTKYKRLSNFQSLSSKLSSSTIKEANKYVELLKEKVAESEDSVFECAKNIMSIDKELGDLSLKLPKLEKEEEIEMVKERMKSLYNTKATNKTKVLNFRKFEYFIDQINEIIEVIKAKPIKSLDEYELVKTKKVEPYLNQFKEFISNVDTTKLETIQVTPEKDSNALKYRFYPPSEPFAMILSKDPYAVDKTRYQELDFSKNKLEVVKKYNFDKIPKLQHGLERVITQRGLHLVNDSSGKPAFTPFLSNIHDFDEIKLHSTYMIPSEDQKLIEITEENKCTYFSSTSSITAFLTHLYLAVSKSKAPPSSMYSSSLTDLSGSFIPSVLKPSSIHLIPVKDNIWSIDNNSGNAEKSNVILMNLGHSMEKMLTLPEDEFNSKILKSNNPGDPVEFPDSYIYSKFDKIIYRSQIDCISDNLPEDRNTFDLKTRATNAIRMNVSETNNFISHHINRLFNCNNSFEREYLDLSRSGGIKYALQAKLGHMAGIFICYHNTRKIFGSEYIDLKELEKSIFWTNHMADVNFNLTNQLLQNVLDHITKDLPRTHKYRLLICSSANFKLNIFVETLIAEDYEYLEFSYKTTKELNENEAKQIKNPVKMYEIKVIPLVNDKKVFSQLHYTESDELKVFYSINQVEKEDILINYALELRQSKLYSQFLSK
ncbi:hypothetical protein DICPUDRAFT_156776 [Dictyostelium purpureum]|uniref:Uncharacterized protein n=1 Tax=Dictyostelium purpureum TaxID=5786 RepID=F0ZXE8_DICPU|nr:uncharacterized protein DICPUDRAFT_156776 [Dictyostelium purpureum]EGC31379.1 hypothetical protein DICPUDRAFT_156776 [Dictyostelium purpureum]|eukprot:XP_003292100.1 hypothetical protein DICPUDRAFT_156776 [Dictyostelium purpureum]